MSRHTLRPTEELFPVGGIIMHAAKIDHYRQERGITKRALAKQLGYTEAYLAKFFSMKRIPRIEFFFRLCMLTGFMIGELLEVDRVGKRIGKNLLTNLPKPKTGSKQQTQ